MEDKRRIQEEDEMFVKISTSLECLKNIISVNQVETEHDIDELYRKLRNANFRINIAVIFHVISSVGVVAFIIYELSLR